MKFVSKGLFVIFILAFGFLPLAFSQATIKGTVVDKSTGELLIGASVIVEGSTDGTVTDFDGVFELESKTSLPLKIVVSYVGYGAKIVDVTSARSSIKVELEEESITTEVVEVRGRRISEKQQQSALTMESLDNIAIKETPAANFYDGLGSLKEVDLTAASLGFKIINTRGFNSTSPVRSLQIIDGVDNQSPGLNFSLGNFLGSSELDVNRVNLIVGASSAFYGPNAFNGVISIETKDPFLHKGLSIMAKGGERALFETGIRWADAVKNKKGEDVLAYKLNAFYFRANDWEADNYDVVFDTPTDETNPGGFDAVNIYGDEFQSANDFSDVLTAPGLGIIHRKGYEERDLVDYDSDNLKLGAALHWRLKPSESINSPTLILSSNFSTGTTVYQGDNRFSLRDIKFYQHRLELNKYDKYFFRFYATHEDAGNSFDPFFTALLLQSNAKTAKDWRADYQSYWNINVAPIIRGLEGYPRPTQFPGDPEGFRAALSSFMQQPFLQDSLFAWHNQASAFALSPNPLVGAVDFFEPGTERFQNEFDDITGKLSFTEGGTKFYDRSALFHLHGEYKFNDLMDRGAISDLDLLVGANGRLYTPDSKGSILLDTFGRNINTYEYGVYGGGTIEFNQRLRVSGSMRLDKHENFEYLVSPAASLVYNPSPVQTLRFSFSSAIRNPTLTNQYLFYNVGRAILIGNLDGFQDLVTVESLRDWANTNNLDTLEYFDVAPIEPEKVKTLEVGYRTTIGNRLFLDGTYYYSFYRDFIGFNIGVDAQFDNTFGQLVSAQAYRVAANATDRVTTQGFSVGFNYYLWRFYAISGNYSWNKLNTNTDDPIIPAFNTPEHKYNIGFGGRDIDLRLGGKRINNLGFNINYKWVDGFIFEGSPQFTGDIPSYALLDAQVNWRSKELNSTFKLGASNILDNQVFQTYGGPRIGRLAYFSVLYEFKKK
ncbi:MAG: TonB-dependent receptor [Lewinellaceae bacterium]|nr:TonB-dependent receptor [Lewinellaceae bacterium]